MQKQNLFSDKKKNLKLLFLSFSSKSLFFVIAFLLLLIVFIFLLLNSYNTLADSIQNERTSYVTEMSSQIIKSIEFMEEQYHSEIDNYKTILNDYDSLSLEEAKRLINRKKAERLFFITTDGEYIDLNGNKLYLLDKRILNNAFDDSELADFFASLNYERDYWLFLEKLDNLKVNDKKCHAIVLAIPAEEFQSNLYISLFDKKGAAYIITKQGQIIMKPINWLSAFDGFNLLSSLKANNIDLNELKMFENRLSSGKVGNQIIHIKKERWLISNSSLDSYKILVILVPLSITAAETYAGLFSTILFAVLSVIAISIISIIIIIFYYKQEKEYTKTSLAMAAKTDFFSKMSHDIRTPINAILGMEMLAKDNIHDTRLAANYLEKATSSAKYLLELINDILDMNRLENNRLEICKLPFNINELISIVKSLIVSSVLGKNISFEIDNDNVFDCYYFGDQIRIKQILINLLSNSVKFTQDGGKISLKIHKLCMPEYDELTFIVSDTGIGISKAYIDKIFDPFEQERSSYTEKHSGSGLGLSIVKSLVTLMEGSICVESNKGVGTEFTVVIPFVRGDKIVSTKLIENFIDYTYKNCNILLTEDDEINQEVIIAILKQKFNIDVDVADNGRIAVNKIKASTVGQYDMILMDVKMPVLDGLLATREIRAIKREDSKTIPIIGLSANAFEEDINEALEAGMNDHLSKPIDIEDLSSVLYKYLFAKRQ